MREERVHEAAMSFACEGEELVGVLSLPVQAPSGTASDLALLVVASAFAWQQTYHAWAMNPEAARSAALIAPHALTVKALLSCPDAACRDKILAPDPSRNLRVHEPLDEWEAL